MAHDQSQLRASFDGAALLYDRARPGYPDAMFDDLVTLTGIPPQGRVLEIGCGTGQATLPLAQRGYAVECIELGANLAAVARAKLAAFPKVQIHVGAFETWPPAESNFDVVFSATAFHWIDPKIRYQRAAAVLRPGGSLAVCWNHHIRGQADVGFFDAVQRIYERETPEITVPDERLLTSAEFGAPEKSAIEASGLFSNVVVRSYEWDIWYTSATYLDVLNTYSGHRLLAPERRARLLGGIAGLIDNEYGGRIAKTYLTNLYVAQS